MELKEIVTVSGKGGLFKVVKPTRTGMILESLDAQKTRFVVGAQHRLSMLSEISVYTHTAEGNTPLQEVLYILREAHGADALPVTGKSDPDELVAFMQQAMPDYDRDRVYASDIKKLVTWYGILREHAPAILERADEEPVAEPSVQVEEAVSAVEKTAGAPQETELKKPKKAAEKKTTEKKMTEKNQHDKA